MLSPFQSTFDPKQSHNNKNNYDKIQNTARFANHKKDYRTFLDSFMTSEFFCDNAGLGFTDYNPKEKDINSMTQTVFYDTEFMRRQQFRMEYEFEKECLNQMARTCLSKYGANCSVVAIIAWFTDLKSDPRFTGACFPSAPYLNTG